MQIRQNVFDLSGGDTTQMLKTKEALENMGIEVDLSLDLRPDVSDYDVVHLFNLTRVQETYIQAINAKSSGKPLVISTIYWPVNEYEGNASKGLRGFLGRHLGVDSMERLKALGKFILRGERSEGARYLITHSYSSMQAEILRMCDVFLPNAISEMREIEKHLGFTSNNVVVVPNAVDTSSIETALADESTEFKKYHGWIVCVGRIDARKNQLNLIRALDGTDYHAVFVGKKSPGHKKYADMVVNLIESNPNLDYIESLTNTDVYKLCKECRVSVLPSWFETPGLASLEAAAMGCNVVVSPKGTTRDYFGDDALYCDVEDPASIRECIEQAMHATPNQELQKRILKDYSWEMAAQKTLEGYRLALSVAGKES